MEAGPLDRMWDRSRTSVRARSRTSVRARVRRLQAKSWQIAQCALAAAAAWLIAADVLGHPTPFFAPVAAVVALGTSYGQRLRRVAEVTVGVAVGVFLADLLVVGLGSGWWQIGLIVALAMSAAFLLDGGQLFVTQAAVQSIVVASLVPDPGAAFTRWTDAVVGGVVALVAATAVPAAPLRRPREQAAVVMRKVAALLRAAGEVMDDGEAARALDLLADARSTDYLIRELQDAADEGLSVVESSPFRVRHKGDLRKMVDLVDPLDRALRSTRVLVRHTAVAAYRRRPVPSSYSLLALDLADAADQVADELAANRMAAAARDALLVVGEATGRVERTDLLTAEAILAQLRSVVADLLMVTGLDQMASTDALPPPPR
ncbi:FUSC family protein [Nocardioides sp.]|uniref:FUSC family protein n=1 Tax=Nocardioides sp. TaxID=35761 RepID=UPI002EDA58CD